MNGIYCSEISAYFDLQKIPLFQLDYYIIFM